MRPLSFLSEATRGKIMQLRWVVKGREEKGEGGWNLDIGASFVYKIFFVCVLYKSWIP